MHWMLIRLAVTLLTNTTDSIESSQPSWSPDGNKDRLHGKAGWHVSGLVNELKLARKLFSLSAADRILWDYLPAWSPDGRTIFFSQRRLGAFRPWLMRIDYEDLSQDRAPYEFHHSD